MSSTSIRNPVDPIERKDIRSANLEFKQDKDKRQKWSNGARLGAGVKVNFFDEVTSISNEGQKIRIRPSKPLYVCNPFPSLGNQEFLLMTR